MGDVKGIKYMAAYRTMSFIRMLSKEVEVNFPEIAGPIFIVNAPGFICTLWKIMRRFLDPTVAAKISIHGNIPKTILAEKIGIDVLPEEFGGTSPYVLPHVENLPPKDKQREELPLPDDVREWIDDWQRRRRVSLAARGDDAEGKGEDTAMAAAAAAVAAGGGSFERKGGDEEEADAVEQEGHKSPEFKGEGKAAGGNSPHSQRRESKELYPHELHAVTEVIAADNEQYLQVWV